MITPSQTAGPYFAYALTPAGRYAIADLATNDLVTDDAVGKRIRIEGRVLDGDGEFVTDAMLEIWQADGEGRYPGADPALIRDFELAREAFEQLGHSMGMSPPAPGAAPSTTFAERYRRPRRTRSKSKKP